MDTLATMIARVRVLCGDENALQCSDTLIEESLRTGFYGAEAVKARRAEVEQDVAAGKLAPLAGALALLAAGGR